MFRPFLTIPADEPRVRQSHTRSYPNHSLSPAPGALSLSEDSSQALKSEKFPPITQTPSGIFAAPEFPFYGFPEGAAWLTTNRPINRPTNLPILLNHVHPRKSALK